MQWTAKRKWAWGSKQRTAEQHTGERYKLYIDVPEPGAHAISFSIREDGFEFDKWLMTTDREYVPTEKGPPTQVKTGTLPKPFLADEH
jgi:hypothetical protein